MTANHQIRRAAANQRRGAVILKIAIALPVIGGFAAVGIDLSYLNSVQADLQRAADAAALAVAARLGQATTTSADPQQIALEVAQDVVNRNPVGAGTVVLELQDIELGRSTYDWNTGRYTWIAAANPPYTAAQVTLRRTNGSPSGPVPLYFGRIIGYDTSELSASARAALAPRAVAWVVDNGRDMNDDSELIHEAGLPIMNCREVWEDLGSPTFGNMTDWNTLVTLTGSPTQIQAALGLQNVPYPTGLGGSWSNYIGYVRNRIVQPYRDRFGLKTFMDYINNEQSAYTASPALANTHQQPMYTQKQIINMFVDYMENLGSGDLAGLCSFNSADPHYEIDMTNQYYRIRDRMNEMIAGYIGDTQNVGSGVNQGRQAFTQGQTNITSGNRVIVLISDGRGQNVGENYEQATQHAVSDGMTVHTISVGYAARPDASAPRGAQRNAFGVMQWIANNGGGVHYSIPPTLDVSTHANQLNSFFHTLRGSAQQAVLIP